ncbi:ABC transporter ATP-binding protein [Marinomonas flavescens]|uniref:ABC transporter ATP-binding protein n=1 Tax=Marinomonas flavescens TaxID=2529379 RepID=UPI001056DA3C|nr:ABC transporter ATP-binding protein [Marinomonas flavescens]
MYFFIKSLFYLLSVKQKRQFINLQVLVILMAFFELVGVASILPFMAVVSKPEIIDTNVIINQVYTYIGSETKNQFTVYLGALVFFSLLLSSIVSIITTWRCSLFASRVGAEIGQVLYDYYLHQSWLFHTSSSTAELTKQIAVEANRFTGGVLQPFMLLNARIVLALSLSLSIFLLDPLIAFVGIMIFLVAYVVIYKTVKNRLEKNGNAISRSSEERFQLMSEAFGGIKDVILLGRQFDFKHRFKITSQDLAKGQGQNMALSQVPRYLIEVIAFGGLIVLVLILLIRGQGDLSQVLPLLSVYALAGFKLLPAFQQVYSSVTMIKGNLSAFFSIRDDVKSAREALLVKPNGFLPEEKLSFEHLIELKDIRFRYPNKNEPVLEKLNLKIEKNQMIGLVGASGSGKSTIVDIIMGLIFPQEGGVYVDDIEITRDNQRAWQNKIGYVAQSIFLSGGTIAENVAFGLPQQEIDYEKVHNAISLAHLDELVQGLENGIYTKVGERGVQLSGGQRQRIGIARALYHDAEVLVFDEATSALDGITEKIIMDSITDFTGNKTIIMIAHRLKTVKKCHQVFLIKKGCVVDNGTFSELLERSSEFNEMVQYS